MIALPFGKAVLSGGPRALLPFSDNFARADGAIGNGWSGATWTIVSNSLINTPGLGSDVAVNGGFDADTNWTKAGGWTIAGGVASHTGASATSISQGNLTADNWYRIDWTLLNYSAGSFFGKPGTQSLKGRTANGTYVDAHYTTTSNMGIVGGVNAVGDVDNVSVKPITHNQVMIARNFGRADVDISVSGTAPGGAVWGVVLNLDNPSSPANYVAVVHDGSNVYVMKCVAGAMSQLINPAATYSAGAVLRVTKSGTTYKVFYNGTQRGSDQTISNVGIISNTYHGMINTYSGNTLDDFAIVAN